MLFETKMLISKIESQLLTDLRDVTSEHDSAMSDMDCPATAGQLQRAAYWAGKQRGIKDSLSVVRNTTAHQQMIDNDAYRRQQIQQ